LSQQESGRKYRTSMCLPFPRKQPKYNQVVYITEDTWHRHKNKAPRIHGIHAFHMFFYDIQGATLCNQPMITIKPSCFIVYLNGNEISMFYMVDVPFQSVKNEAKEFIEV
jgi:hypothetical protein